MKQKTQLKLSAIALTMGLFTGMAHADNVKIALIDPLSGSFAALGENSYVPGNILATLPTKKNGPANTPWNLLALTTKRVYKTA